MTKERPILFSGPMVRAILDGRKTQTRRVFTRAHAKRLGLDTCGDEIVTSDGPYWNGEFHEGSPPWSPYGLPGDVLWVRETWAPHADEERSKRPAIFYRADCDDTSGFPHINNWRPSIHMPRWACRLTLRVESVRVERLNDISEEDAIAEGVTNHSPSKYWDPSRNVEIGPHQHEFMRLWDSINGKKYPWASNPWVWVVTFARL